MFGEKRPKNWRWEVRDNFETVAMGQVRNYKELN